MQSFSTWKAPYHLLSFSIEIMFPHPFPSPTGRGNYVALTPRPPSRQRGSDAPRADEILLALVMRVQPFDSMCS